MSATQAAEHPWLGRRSTTSARRRAARAKVASVTADRAVNTVERLQARVKRSSLRGHMAAMKTPNTEVAKATAETALAEIAQLVTMMSVEVFAAGREVKRWDKVAAGDRNAASGGCGTSSRQESAVVRKAEEALRLAEVFAGQAEASGGPAVAVFDAWEKARAQEARQSVIVTVNATKTSNDSTKGR